MTERFIQIGYILLPFAFLSMGKVCLGHQKAFLILGLLIAGSIIKNRYLRWLVYYIACWHLFICVASVSFARTKLSSHVNVSLAESELTYFFYGIVFYCIIANSKKPVEWFYDAICICAFLQVIIGYIQWIFEYFPIVAFAKWLTLPMGMRLSVTPLIFGTLQNPNFLATVLVISTPFFFRKSNFNFTIPLKRLCKKYRDVTLSFELNLIYVVPFIIVLVGRLHTSTAVIALVVGMLIHLKRPIYFAGVVGALIFFVFVVDISPITGSPRWLYWAGVSKHGLISTSRFLFGYGPGRYLEPVWPALHNDVIQSLWFELGWTGLCLLGCFLLNTLKDYKKYTILVSSIIISSICAFGSYPIRLAPSAFLIIMTWALMEKLQYGRFSYIQEHI